MCLELWPQDDIASHQPHGPVQVVTGVVHFGLALAILDGNTLYSTDPAWWLALILSGDGDHLAAINQCLAKAL